MTVIIITGSVIVALGISATAAYLFGSAARIGERDEHDEHEELGK